MTIQPRLQSFRASVSRLALVVAALVALSACARPAVPDSTITACYSGTDATSSAVLYAADHGFFERNDLQVTLLFANGGSAAVATLLSGQSQICQMSGANVVPAAQAGEDLVVVAGIVNTTPFKLIAAPTMTRPEQLVGQTFSSPAGGGSYELGLRLQLASIGVPFEQVKFAPLGSQAAVIAAMQAGAVAAALQVPPETEELLSQGFIEVPFGAGARPAFQHIGLVVRKSYLQAHRPRVLAYVRAVGEAIAAMKGDEAGTSAVIAKYRRLDPVAQKASLSVAHREIVQGIFAAVPRPTLEGMAYIISQLPPAPNARRVTAADVVDTSVVAELERAGAFAGTVE
jgi:ABC-type nitrate/sulfonate/bicarbonate transport system substrate-binding protein